MIMKSICTNCNIENDAALKYCSICGYELPKTENKELKSKSDATTKPNTKKRLDAKTLIGVVVGAVVGLFVTQSLFKPSIDKQLSEIANEMNKTCPINVDESTTLKNVVALTNKTIQYNYVLVGITKAEVEIDTIKKYVFPGILQNVKTNPELKLFRDNKVSLKYYYVDKNGEFIADYIVKPEMYE